MTGAPAGGEPWEYQSCTPTITPHASMDGYFTFTVNYESGRKSFINVKVHSVRAFLPNGAIKLQKEDHFKAHIAPLMHSKARLIHFLVLDFQVLIS